jgi:hypothetical protein
MMGVPLDGPSRILGDNQSVIASCTIPKSSLNKWHNSLSYHLVHECIAMSKVGLNSGHSSSPYCAGRVNQFILDHLLPEIIKEIKTKIMKDKEKDPTSALRGVSGGVNPAVGSSTNVETTWAGTTDSVTT